MQKKSALEVACEEYVKLLEWTNNYLVTFNSADMPPCPILKDIGTCIHKDTSCKVCIKQHFQNKSDIPDGWDVVKEIYEDLQREQENIIKYEDPKDPDWKVVLVQIKATQNNIKDKLEKAGIEVE